MTCTIIAHTRFEDAVDLLARDLARSQTEDPLAVSTILVQGNAIGRWLSTELARRSEHGIAAGLDLRPVGAFCRGLVAPPSGSDPFSMESMIWTVDAALNDRDWVASAAGGDSLRLALAALDRAATHALSVHLAGILDRYQFERPDWIAAWTAGATVAAAQQTPWLAALWSRIRTTAGRLPPLSLRIDALTSSLAAGGALPPSCPTAVWIVAPSSLPPLLIRLLTALGDHGGAAVRILHLVPATHASMWAALENERLDYDPETTPMGEQLAGAHPLLAAYARQSHDLAVMLADLGEGRTRTIDFDAILPRPRPQQAPLLAQLQSQIWDARCEPLHVHVADDRSLTVHRCHSPLREVEVLRDALVAALTAPDAPRPDEVLVAVTDIETYGPLLAAVLGEDRGDQVRFPVRLVGEPVASDPLITALLAILALPGSEASLPEVLAPCDAHAIRQRFGLDEQDLSILRHRLEAAGVSWGLDAAQRQRANAYASGEGSWRVGVDRLLLGLITGPEAQVLPGCFAAGGQLSGDADAVGGIAIYLGILQRFAAEAGDGSLTKPVAAWRTLLFGLLADVADAQRGPDARALAVLRGAIAAIPISGADPDLRTIRKHLTRMLDEDQHASTWSRGGITVAPLSALRHAPHAVIAILGLDSSFPRIHTASAFDPAAAQRRRGDLSARLDARQLFLDLILAARQRVHLSWTGWSTTDGSAREASATVEDLLRHVDRWLTAPGHQTQGRAAVLVNHRLHASDAAYFNGVLPRSHDALACAAANARRARDAGEEAPGVQPFLVAPAAPAAPEILEPDDLLAWCRDPAKQFTEQVLGLRFPRHDTLAEHEPIALDGLESWHLRQAVVDGMLSGNPVQEARLRQDGLLPHGPAGTNLLSEHQLEAAAVTARLDAALAGLGCTRDAILTGMRRIAVTLPGEGAPRRIAGTVLRCAPHVALALHSGALKGVDLLDAWVLHQLLNADARTHHAAGVSTVLLGRAGSGGALKALQGCCVLPASAASEEHWRAIAAALRSAWRQPQPFFPDVAAACWQWGAHRIREDALDQHLAAWRGGADDLDDSRLRSELATSRPWTRLVWRGVPDPTAQWGWFVDHLWAPAARAAQGEPERAP